MRPSPRPHSVNIVSMDGGGVLGLLTFLILQQLEGASPGFLKHVDMFAGTSAGGINALCMAAYRDARVGLRKACEFFNEVEPTFSWEQTLLGLSGLGPFNSSDDIREALIKKIGKTKGRDKRLGDLYRQVVVPTVAFKLGVGHDWKPKVFQNFPGHRHDPDLRELAIDVALRTSAVPIVLPIHQGYTDGGTFANHPSLAALAEVIKRNRRETGSHGLAHLEHINVLAVGTGSVTRGIACGSGDWGWLRWLADPDQPLLLLAMAYDSVELAVGHQTEHLLGRDHYRQINPNLLQAVSQHDDLGFGFKRSLAALREICHEVAESPDTQVQVAHAVDWLRKGTWYH